jgi:hypothetical protein
MTKLQIEEPQTVSRTVHAAPTQRELFLLLAVSFVVFWTSLFLLHKSTDLVVHSGDNAAYRDVANAILHWDFHDLQVQHFMGYPYLIALVSLLFRVPTGVALWVIAVTGCVASVWLTARLFGTTVAGYFAFTNVAWLQVSYLGGSEPLAAALGLGSLLAFRRDRIVVSALLASLAVTVRPLMFFVLVGIGLVLLYRKQFWQFLAALGIGLGMGILYVLPLARYFGDPLLTVHSYTSRDYGAAKVVGPHGHLFGWPLHGIVVGTLTYPAPWTNLVLSFFWIGLVLLGVGMMFSDNFRKYAKSSPNEAIFCGLYLFAIFSYDYLIWARSNFIRFCIPTLPFVFFALLPLLPKDRRVIWGLCLVSAVASAVSAVGLKNVFAGMH